MLFEVKTCTPESLEDWGRLRHALWPEASVEILTREAENLLARGDALCLVAMEGGAVIGFAEARLREYANGCEGSPVPFVEGLYVIPAWRKRGVARALIAAVEKWAKAQGLGELGSDVLLGNTGSQKAHAALGFTETERVIYFRKILTK